MYEEDVMKTRVIFCIIAAFILFQGSSPWEGAAAVAPEGELPATGRFIATNLFPRNTVVDITNIENNRSIRVIVANRLESPGLVALVSREAAELIGMRTGSTSRVRMIQPSDPIAYLRFIENATTGVIGGDPEIVITEENLYEDHFRDDQYIPPVIERQPPVIPPTPPVIPEPGPGYVIESEWSGPGRVTIVDVPDYNVEPFRETEPVRQAEVVQPDARQQHETAAEQIKEQEVVRVDKEPIQVAVVEKPEPERQQPDSIHVTDQFPSHINEHSEIVKDVPARYDEIIPAEIVKEVPEYISEEPRDEIVKTSEDFITETGREEVVKEAEVFVTETSRNEVIKETDDFITETGREEIVKDAEIFVTEVIRDEVIKPADNFITENIREDFAKDVFEYVVYEEQERIPIIIERIVEIIVEKDRTNEIDRNEIIKDVLEYITEDRRDEVIKDVSEYVVQVEPERVPIIVEKIVEIVVERDRTNEIDRNEIIKDVLDYITESSRDEVVKDPYQYITETPRDEIIKAADNFITENIRDEVVKDVSEYIVQEEQERIPIIIERIVEIIVEKDRTNEIDRNEIIKDVLDYITEDKRDEVIKDVSEYVVQVEPERVPIIIEKIVEIVVERDRTDEIDRNEIIKDVMEYITEDHRNEIIKSPNEFITENIRDEVIKDVSEYIVQEEQERNPIIIERIVEIFVERERTNEIDRNEIIKDVSDYVTEDNRDEVIKDVSEYVVQTEPERIPLMDERDRITEINRNEVIKDVPEYFTEDRRDEIIKDVSDYIVQFIPEKTLRDEWDSSDFNREEVDKKANEFITEADRDEVIKGANEYITEADKDEIIKDTYDFITETQDKTQLNEQIPSPGIAELETTEKTPVVEQTALPAQTPTQQPSIAIATPMPTQVPVQTPPANTTHSQNQPNRTMHDPIVNPLPVPSVTEPVDEITPNQETKQEIPSIVLQEEIPKPIRTTGQTNVLSQEQTPEQTISPLQVQIPEQIQEQNLVIQNGIGSTELEEYHLVETNVQVPTAELYGINPNDIIPGISAIIPESSITSTAVQANATERQDNQVQNTQVINPVVVVSEPSFSVQTISQLDHGRYYVQVAMSTENNVENIIRQIDRNFNPVVFKDRDNLYRILIGPLNQGESAAVLQRFRSIGYRDAFVRSGS